MPHRLPVRVATPAHSALHGPLTYLSEEPLAPGTMVRVPLATREVLGIVWDSAPADSGTPQEGDLRPLAAVLRSLPPLDGPWRQLVDFAARYYQRSAGEVALAALPPALRQVDEAALGRRLARARPKAAAREPTAQPAPVTYPASDASAAPAPNAAQQAAIDAIASAWAAPHEGQAREPGVHLLFGATGSGKTEVYLRAVQQALQSAPPGPAGLAAQALVMVPEINLTPQLEQRFRERFAPLYGDDAVVSMHSAMTPAQRLRSWIAAHTGQARIVLGTRLAVLASLPALRLIVVDEEHDPSYKQQEGARHSARDLAIYRGRLQGAAVVLGSATPSLESWHAAQQGRYRLLALPQRIGDGALPQVRVVDMRLQPRGTIFSGTLLDALRERLARGEQALLFLNRRGYAPVLACSDCGWKSECPHCSAYRVFHKSDRTLRCHHCGLSQRVPRACPGCGNLDIAALGRGTEQLEERVAELLRSERNAQGEAVRIARIDADSARSREALAQQLAQVHAGEVDVLVGTQMVAKGHDFRRITLVAAVNPDMALFSSDFRAPERLFSLLLQAAGRAGRDAQHAARSEMWVQTFHPEHPMFDALRRHDYEGFAAQQLREREQAGMPPFAFQALVRAEARTQESAQAFLRAAREGFNELLKGTAPQPGLNADAVRAYPPVPMGLQRVANVERAQMLVEAPSRAALQRLLQAWQPLLRALPRQGVLRWAVDVDPLAV
jgi:primosomal protein N' (replication factor Y)